ncbi:MAG: hypothetical protein LBT78_12545, partial [Tannerella sp.]|nr:hypothetical protein [Tannerella sp.]
MSTYFNRIGGQFRSARHPNREERAGRAANACASVRRPAAFGDESADLTVEPVGCQERLQGEVHPVTPVVMRVGGQVDAFGRGLGTFEGVAHGEPVLQGDN